MWTYSTERLDPAVLATRPAPEVWSALEYAAHSRDQIAMMGKLLHAVLTTEDLAFDEPPEPPSVHEHGGTIEPVIDALRANAVRVYDKVAALDADALRRTFTLGGDQLDLGWVVRHAVHDSMHHLQDVGRGLHSLGAGAPTQQGTIIQVNASDGGVPKLPVDAADVGYRGVVGDRQHSRQHHGRPWQALCLFSGDVIDALRAEGHPIHPGNVGENITVSGIDWGTLRPGVRLLIGEVLAEVSAYATPCKKNAQFFTGGDFNRMQHERNLGWSRLYASVLEPGRVTTGDPIIVEP
jgi:MOSC domain-containing protein YiiM